MPDLIEPAAPASTAVAAYTATEAALAELKHRLGGAVYAITTTAGLDTAKKDRRALVTLRTSLESLRKTTKAPLLTEAEKVDAEAKRITAAIKALEEPIDQQIVKEEARREAEKLARIRADQERIAAIDAGIQWFRDAIVQAAGKKADEIRALLLKVEGSPITTEIFAEKYQDAERIKAQVMTELYKLTEAARLAEAEAAAVAAQLAELAELKAKAKAREAEDRARREAEAKAAREAREAEEKALLAQREAEERAIAARRAEEAEAAKARQAEIDAAQQREREQLEAEWARLADQRKEAERREREIADAEAARQRILKQAQQEAADHDAARREAEEVEAARLAAEESLRQAPAVARIPRPTDETIMRAIVSCLGTHFRVHDATVLLWLQDMDLDLALEGLFQPVAVAA